MCTSRVNPPQVTNSTSLPVSSLLDAVPEKPPLSAEAAPKSKVSSKKPRHHIVVEHHYHEHAFDAARPSDFAEESRGGVNNPFPLKLHEMLDRVEEDGYAHIVSWQPHGRCFVVHKPDEFKEVLPKYFTLSKIASFQRQLNLYGFQRLTAGMDKGGYYNELFLRGRVYLAHRIPRVKVKGTGIRARSNPGQEPDFWKMPWVGAAESPDGPASQAVDGNASVVSDDSSCVSPVPSESPSEPPSEPVSTMEVDESENDDLLVSWGRPFHYLDPRTFADDLVFPDVDSTKSLSRMASLPEKDMDSMLNSLDFEGLVQEVFESDNEESLGDMLERAVE